MQNTALHLSTVELEQGLAEVIASPRDSGRVEAIFVRPATNERRSLTEAQLTPEGGVEGDRWVHDGYYHLPDSRSDPRNQVSLMNARILRQIAGRDDDMCLAGDNLIVDLDLSEDNLPTGSQLQIGPDVILEISDLPHTGCTKLAARYGKEAKAFINNKRGKELHLRGRYAHIVHGGAVHVGDSVSKLATS